jgi:phage tail-like protein
MSYLDEPAVSVRFLVSIDKNQLGYFNSCEGLGCEIVVEKHEEGGNNGMVWQLPTRIVYPTIKLTRPVTKDTAMITKWIASLVTGLAPTTGSITAMTGDGDKVAVWNLLDVIPVRWTGPILSPESPKVATETLEIAHHGFLWPGSGV